MDETDGHLGEVPVPRAGVVLDVLTESRARGLIGPAPLGDQVRHSLAFVQLLPESGTVADLGSGGGLPGLVIADSCPELSVTLVDASARRCRFLEWAVAAMGLEARVEVVHGRAEDLGRRPSLRGAFDAVTARSFGPPAVTAECGRALLRPGGVLVVSDPPAGGSRWDDEGLARLALVRRRDDAGSSPAGGPRFTVLVAEGRCPETVPRRSGIPAKRPLF